MKIKVNKHKLNIHYRGSPWGSRTQQHPHCLRYAHSHHTESHLGKKQPHAKIAIAFLFGQLHFNNVTSHALFYGGHLVLRSKICAMQNQGITLRQERLREYLYMALNPHIAIIKCVKDLCCELAVKVHGKYSTAPVSADIYSPITVIRRLMLYVM